MEDISHTETSEKNHREKVFDRRHLRDSNAWPLVLIIFGLYFLLRNFNIVNDQILEALVSAWPLLLVWLGVNLAAKDNPQIKAVGRIAIIAILVFIVLQKMGVSLPRFR